MHGIRTSAEVEIRPAENGRVVRRKSLPVGKLQDSR